MTKPDLDPKAFLELYKDNATTFVLQRAGRLPEKMAGDFTLLGGLGRLLKEDPMPSTITATVHYAPDDVSITDKGYMAALLVLVRDQGK
jgi:hypothetical protein